MKNILLFSLSFLFCYCCSAQATIPKKASAVVVEAANPDVKLKELAGAMIKKGFRIKEKDFDIGYVTGEWTQEEKFFALPLRIVATGMEEDGRVVIRGKFSVSRTLSGDYVDFSTSKWFGGKQGGYKVSFGKLIELGFALSDEIGYE